MIISTGKSISIREPFDPDASLHYIMYLKPPVWNSSEEKVEGDIISPSSPTGYVYKVVSGGITGTVEPSWPSTKGDRVVDNTVEYIAISNSYYLSANASLIISGNAPTATSTDLVPVNDLQYDSSGRISFKVGPVPSGVDRFSVTVGFYVDNGFATPDYDERTINFEVGQR